MVPSRYSEVQELPGIGSAFKGLKLCAFGINSDFDVETELAWMTKLGQDTGRPVWFLLTDRPTDPVRWQRLMEGVRTARAQGAFVTAGRRPPGWVMLGVYCAEPVLDPAELSGTAEAACQGGWRLQDPAVRGDLADEPRRACGGFRSSASPLPPAGIACSSWASAGLRAGGLSSIGAWPGAQPFTRRGGVRLSGRAGSVPVLRSSYNEDNHDVIRTMLTSPETVPACRMAARITRRSATSLPSGC